MASGEAFRGGPISPTRPSLISIRMLTGLQIKNFKSIEDSGLLQLKPLTIFTGPNASGKSNILESLAVLAQATRLERGVERSLAGSLTHGDLVRYPHPWTDYATHRKDPDRWISFEVHARPSDAATNEIRAFLRSEVPSIGYGYSYKESTRDASTYVIVGNGKLVEVRRETTDSSQRTRVVCEGIPPELEMEDSSPKILDSRCFTFRRLTKPEMESFGDIADPASTIARMIVVDLARCLERTYLLSALRGGVDAEVKTGSRPNRVGKCGEHLVEILALCFSREEYSAKKDRIDEWSQKFGLGKIGAGWWGGDQLGSDFIDPVLKTHLNLVLASGGSRQVLSMIVQLFWSEPGDIVMIEEPEMSLHPESQVLLQDLFATAVAEGKQIICSTHSPFLVLALSKVLKNGKLSRDNVVVHHVEKGESGTKIKQLQLNQNGFVTGWIPSYLKVENELFDEWAESLEED